MNSLLAHMRNLFERRSPEYPDVLELLFRHADALFAVTNLNGTIIKASNSMVRELGETGKQKIDHFSDLLHHTCRYDYSKALEYVKRENKPVQSLEVQASPQLRDRKMKLTILPIPTQHDSQVHLFHLLGEKAIDSHARTDLSHVEKLTNVGQIAAGIAHELNTPLGSIILSASSIVEASEQAEIVEEASRIKRRAEHCSTVVKELLSYVRHSDKGHERHNLLAIVNKVVNLMATEFRQRNISLTVTPPDEDIALTCNENQIEQVLFNLINNAIYAIEQDGRIQVCIRRDALLKRAYIVVKDDGKGISPENIEKIFDPFFTTKPGAQGTGLGLAICKKIALEHGGDITVVSKESEGSAFETWLPITNE